MATKRPGRPAKHDWTDKHDICYRLYVEENKSIKEIVEYFANVLGVALPEIPSSRDFSRQFSRWQFPARREKLSPDDEAHVVERLKQFWQANYVQKQMLEALAEEGWQLDQHALSRLRRKHGIMLRVAAGYNTANVGPGTGKKRKRVENEESAADVDASVVSQVPERLSSSTEVGLPPEEAARRAQRLLDVQAASDAQFNARKRRRRIRGLGHLPPDAPGLPPRYKSETSLDECKAFLNLTNDTYKAIREQFEAICTEMGIMKKRDCSGNEWSIAKTRLVRENIYLSATLNPVHGDVSDRENALEVICSDVTKRMRTMKTRIFVKQANNILGLDPEESKELRRQFYEILKDDQFQTMLLCGKEHWEELKQRWIASSAIVQRLYAQGLDEGKRRCLDVLIRDAMKRHNDNNVTKISHLSDKDNAYGPGPGPARRVKDTGPVVANSLNPLTASPAKTSTTRHMDLDPALFAALSPDLAMLPSDRAQSTTTTATAVPAYFRLAPISRLSQSHPKMWLGSLPSPTLAAIHTAATSKAGSAQLSKVFGILKNESGQEDSFQIDNQDELEAYFEATRELADGKATFSVVLVDV